MEVKTLFEKEINDPKLTIETVKKKIPSSTFLKDLTSKRVHDKIYIICHHSKPDQVDADLPEEQEDLPTKIRRTLLQKNKEDRDYVPDAELPYEQEIVPTKVCHNLLRKPGENRDYVPDVSSDIDNRNIMAPTRTSQRVKDILSEQDVHTIKTSCIAMVKGKPISIIKIKRWLDASSKGKQILDHFDIKQIQNRIEYERKMYRERK